MAAPGFVAAPADAELTFGRLVEKAEGVERSGLEDAGERARLNDALKAAELSLKRAKEKVANAQSALVPWDQEWARAIKAAALSAEVSHAVGLRRGRQHHPS